MGREVDAKFGILLNCFLPGLYLSIRKMSTKTVTVKTENQNWSDISIFSNVSTFGRSLFEKNMNAEKL